MQEKIPLVIDGQQRLTTILIALGVLHEMVDKVPGLNPDIGDVPGKLKGNTWKSRLLNAATYEEDSAKFCRFRIEDTDADDLDRYLRDNACSWRSVGTGHIVPIKSARDTIIAIFQQYMNKDSRGRRRTRIQCRNALHRLLKHVTENIVLGVVWVNDSKHAHIVFQSLNNRGTDLSIAEMVSSLILFHAERVSTQTNDLVARSRETLTYIIGRTGASNEANEDILTDFFVRYHYSKHPYVPADKLYDIYESELRSYSTVTGFTTFLRDLRHGGDAYVRVKTADVPSPVKYDVMDMNSILSQPVPLLMRALIKGLEPAEFISLVRGLCVFVVRYFVASRIGNDRGRVLDTEYSEWAGLINDHGFAGYDDTAAITRAAGKPTKCIKQQLRELIIGVEQNDDDSLNNAIANTSSKKGTVWKLILRRTLHNITAYDTKEWHAEHIAPMGHVGWPTGATHEWNQTFEGRDYASPTNKHWIKGRIGNFLIVQKKTNYDVKAKDFNGKLRIYKLNAANPLMNESSELTSEFTDYFDSGSTVKDWASSRTWNPEQIHQRSLDLSQSVAAAFPMSELN